MTASTLARGTAASLLIALLGASCGDGPDADAERRTRVPKLRGPELVPQELVGALLTGLVSSGPTVPEIVVGRVPDNMPFEIPRPENARVLGALAGRSGGTLVLSVAQPPIEAIERYRELLQRTGWDDPRDETGGGFQPPATPHLGPFCQGEKRWINVSSAERSDGQTLLQIRYSEGGSYSPCDDRQRENVSPRRGPIPTLYPPSKTSVVHANVGGGRYDMEASGRLSTELQPAQLVTHYAAQLRAQGWSPQSESSGAGVAAQTWRITDRRGKAWVGTLLAIAIPDSDDREVVFRVVPLDRER